MKLLGDSLKDRSYDITAAVSSICYSLDKLTAQEAIITLDMVRQLVQTKMNEEWSQNQVRMTTATPGITINNCDQPLTGSTTL